MPRTVMREPLLPNSRLMPLWRSRIFGRGLRWLRSLFPTDTSRAPSAHDPDLQQRHEVEPERHPRHFSENNSAALLAAIGECRRACVAANSKAPIGGPIYRLRRVSWMRSIA